MSEQSDIDALFPVPAGYVDDQANEAMMAMLAAGSEVEGNKPVQRLMSYKDEDGNVVEPPPPEAKSSVTEWLATMDALAWIDVVKIQVEHANGNTTSPAVTEALLRSVPILLDEVRAQVELRQQVIPEVEVDEGRVKELELELMSKASEMEYQLSVSGARIRDLEGDREALSEEIANMRATHQDEIGKLTYQINLPPEKPAGVDAALVMDVLAEATGEQAYPKLRDMARKIKKGMEDA